MVLMGALVSLPRGLECMSRLAYTNTVYSTEREAMRNQVCCNVTHKNI